MPNALTINHKLPIEGIVEAVIDGVKVGLKGHNVKLNLIGIMSHSFGQTAYTQELEGILSHKQYLVVIDVAGGQLDFPSELINVQA